MNKKFSLQNDIRIGLKKYPNLTLRIEKDTFIVQGNWLAIDRKNNVEIALYEVIISFDTKYPNCFPKVWEISNKIPKDLDRHIKKDGTLCFANPQDELRVCKTGITFVWFLENILNTHLVREYYREMEGEYPTGERSHGNEGIWEGYYEIFLTKNKAEILKQLEIILQAKSWARNAKCYCNTSEKKYKSCHEKIEKLVFTISKKDVGLIYNILKKDFENKHNERFT